MINQDSILLFGSSGQIGKTLIRKFTKNNYRVIAVTRNIHRKGYQIKTQSNYGYLELEELNSFAEDKISNLMKKCSICINLVGILFENKKNDFKMIHTYFPSLLSKIAKQQRVKQFIHISALGIEEAKDSRYAASKLEGEIEVRKNFPNSLILKPSVVYSVNDNFTTILMGILNVLPFMPLYYKGKTKFTPIHVSELANIILEVIEKKILAETIECVGPEILTFKEIILKILNSINKKTLLIPMPLTFAKLSAKIFQIMPKPLLTIDQLNLLKYDNIVSGKYKTNFDYGMNSVKRFEDEIKLYSYNWTKGGQFTKKNVQSEN